MKVQSQFVPAWWLQGPNQQTCFPSFFRKRNIPEGFWKRLELADGDFLDLYISGKEPEMDAHAKKPMVVLLHYTVQLGIGNGLKNGPIYLPKVLKRLLQNIRVNILLI